MPTYHVFLGNPSGYAFRWRDLVDAVHALFAPAIGLSRHYDSLRVQSTMTAPALHPGEVLIYVVRNQFRSIVCPRFSMNPDPGHGGITFMSSQMSASEVYLQGNSIEQSARNIVHEWLHNKTGKDNNQLHPLGGVCASPAVAPSRANHRLIANHLHVRMGQWLDAFHRSGR